MDRSLRKSRVQHQNNPLFQLPRGKKKAKAQVPRFKQKGGHPI